MTVRSFTDSTRINLPVDQLDVREWLFQMTDAEYAEASSAHRAAGVWQRNGERGMVNVESIGGHLFVQHYTEVPGTPDKVVMYSPASRMYLLHTVPVSVAITWTMWVEADGPDASRFHCTVQVEMGTVLGLMGASIGTFRAARKHTEDETVGYARDLERAMRAKSAR